MLNKSIVQGRLVAAPELRSTQSGKSVAAFTLAWSEKYGEQEQQLFIPCVAWGKVGESASRYFAKGQEALVEGKLITRKWQDKEGNNRSTTELIVERMHFCGPKRSDQPGGNSSGYAPPSQNNYSAGNNSFAEINDDDGDLPF